VELYAAQPVETQRNRQADDEHVHQNPLNQPAVLIRTHKMVRAQRQHNEIHHQKHRNPIEETANQPMIPEEFKSAARQAVNRRSRERDEVVQGETENPGTRSTIDSLPADQPPAMTRGLPSPNVMNAAVMSNVPASAPPTRIGLNSFPLTTSTVEAAVVIGTPGFIGKKCRASDC